MIGHISSVIFFLWTGVTLTCLQIYGTFQNLERSKLDPREQEQVAEQVL